MKVREKALEACVIYDENGALVACDKSFQILYGYLEGDLTPGVHFTELDRLDVERGIVVPGKIFSGIEDYLEKKTTYRRKLEGSFIVQLADGRAIKITDRPLSTGGFVSIQTDITEFNRVNEKLQRTSDLFMSAFHINSSVCAISVLDTGKFIEVNAAWVDILGYARSESIGKTSAELNIWEEGKRSHILSILERDGLLKDYQSSLITKSGERREFLMSANILTVTDTQCVFFSGKDITEKVKNRKALEASQNQFTDFTRSSSDWHWEIDAAGIFTYISSDVELAAGVSQKDYLGNSIWRMLSGKMAEQRSLKYMKQCLLNQRSFRDVVSWRMQKVSGKKIWLRRNGVPFYDDNGAFAGFRGSSSNVTEQKNLEEKLQQSQKMEAVGQLTGGVAHDFNNLLAVILGNMDIVKDTLNEGAPIDMKQVDAVIRAAERGAELTQNMLSFSRKQNLMPEEVKLEEQVSAMISLLKRALGEAIDIDVRFGKDLWTCHADPGKVENALLNLAINARDAMPSGGTLKIEVENATLSSDYTNKYTNIRPGNYVMMAVSDTGIGISADIVEHVFEPFYTTKETGKGTGLGLSMVYGFAQQSDGHLALQSEVGRGTRVELFLPQSEEGLIEN
ncbi:MAG: PAS domain S-box protein [Sneathiella sp.]